MRARKMTNSGDEVGVFSSSRARHRLTYFPLYISGLSVAHRYREKLISPRLIPIAGAGTVHLYVVHVFAVQIDALDFLLS